MSSSVFLAGLENELKTGGDPSAFAYDHSFFAHLSAMEQLVAENLLIEASRRGDTKASGTLGNLGCVRALPLLDDLSASSPATAVRAAARRAVALIRPSSAASAAVAEDLAEGQPIDRLLASETLRQQPDEAATRGLLDALQVDDLFVRDGAWDGLLDRLGLPRTTGADDFGPLSALHLRVICTLKTVWNPATSRARKLFQRILAGEAPAVVIPTYVPGDPALRAAALATLNATTGDPINLAPILAMSGHDREWFESNLLSRIGDKDVRAIDAAAALRIKGVENVLHEGNKAWSAWSPELAVTIRAALLFLQR